ncbi:MAG: glycosyl hydrolase [Bacteroidota bacterium]
MNRIISILLLLLLFSCNKKFEIPNTEPLNGRITSFGQLAAHFQDPPSEYRTAPFWVWNNDVSKEDIDRTLSEFKDKGIGGVFLHPRYGLITEYLSEEWFELTEYSLKRAEELDMKLWIYDENSFPSGFAGGHVAAQMPEANSEGIALKPYLMDVLQIPDEVDRPKHIFKKEGENWIEITGNLEKEKGKKGEFCVLALNDYSTSKWYGGYSYVDLLKPGVTEKFLEITMPGYEKSIGHEFGGRVPGVFTDEPNTNTMGAGPIRYTPDLYEQFEKQWGYDLQPHIMSLITETGDWKKVRHNYQSTILQLFIDRWSKPWNKYTEEKNLQWTGHYWEHGWPSPKEGPDNMAMYAWHQTPAVDMLFNAEESRPDQFGNIRNIKELSSVVNQFERHRALSETYGAAGWELTFDDMKRLGDWEFVLGVNFMNQHLSYISMAGDRKHDFPQSFGTHSPYWGLFRYQADYFARLSMALSSGFQRNHILIIEPTTTAWMYYNPTDRANEKMYQIQKQFEPFLEQLEKFQVEYDLGCENIIKDHGKIEEGKFVINKAAYDLVILPPGIENLDATTHRLIEEFTQNGGKVMQVNANLQFVDGMEHEYSELQNIENWEVIDAANEDLYKKLAKNDDIEFEDINSVKGKVFHQRREFEDGQLIFLTNFHRDKTTELKINMPGKSVIDLNAANGKIEPYIFKRISEKVHFELTLPPSGSKLLYISNKRKKSQKAEVKRNRNLVESGKSKVSKITPNILNLDYVELTMGKFKSESMYFYQAGNEIWKQHGYPDNPWVSSSQFKTELIDVDNFAKGTGFTICYPFYTDESFNNTGINLVVERPWLYEVAVNGKPVTAVDKWWTDPDFHLFNIGELIQQGRNEVVITASPFSIYCELEPVYLLGDFYVNSIEKGFIIQNEEPLSIGSWKEQGMPFYGQTVSYSKDIKVKIEGDFIIRMPEWKGTVAEVLIDGEHQGIVQSKPYELKVRIPYGQHTVSVNIVGSNKNTFGPHHNFKTPGIVTPWSFKLAPEIQPPGTGYDLLDYGLMQDFEIYRLE